MKLNIRIIALMMVLINLCFQANSQVLSLSNVLDSVEQKNPLISSYNYKIEGTNALADAAKSWMPPRIGAGFDQTPYRIQNGETFFNRTQGATLISIEQDIPNPAKQKAKQNYLYSLVAIDSSEIILTKNKLFTEAKTAYIERFISEKRIKIIREEIDLLKLIIETSTNAYAQNQGDLASIFKAKARQHTLEAMEVHEQGSINESNAALSYLMVLPQGTSFDIDSVIPFHQYSLASLDTSVSFLTAHNSEIKKFDNSIQALNMSNALTLSNAKPDFNIRYEHYNMFGSRNTFSLMGSVTIPIVPWSSRGYKRESFSIRKNIDAMNAEKQNALNESRSLIHKALLNAASEYKEVNYFEKEILPAYKKTFETSILAYKENTGSLLFALMAWDDLNSGEVEYLYHLEQAYKAEIEYERTIEKK